MALKFDLPVTFFSCSNDYQLDKFIKLVKMFDENIRTIYAPLGYIDNEHGVFGLRCLDEGEEKVSPTEYESKFIEICEATGKPVKILANELHAETAVNNPLFLKKLIYLKNTINLDSVVIADPMLLPILAGAGVKATLSVNAAHNEIELAQFLSLKHSDIIREVVMYRDWNRSLKTLRRVSKIIGPEIDKTIMINEGCIVGCPYRTSGDIQISNYNNKDSKTVSVHGYGCQVLDPWLFLTSPFLTKEMIRWDAYDGYTFKIAGRNLGAENLKVILDYYVNEIDCNVNEILNTNKLPDVRTEKLTKEFRDKVSTCDKICSRCRYCETFYENLK